MYPYPVFMGLTLYEICLFLAIIAALAVFRILADQIKMQAKVQNFIMILAIASAVLGYFCAVLTQSVYDAIKTGEWVIDSSTGSTFFGGLVGGVGIGLALYYGVGKLLFPAGEHRACVADLLNIAACAIPVAHAVGRLGCFFAGCCAGHESDSVFAVDMLDYKIVDSSGNALEYVFHSVIPVQLYEALFLIALAAFLIVRFLEKRGDLLPTYALAYGVWRFWIEFLRGDDRGATVIPFLSPSQLTAIILVIAAVCYFVGKRKNKRVD